jgi:hypothetical protein
MGRVLFTLLEAVLLMGFLDLAAPAAKHLADFVHFF